MVLTNSWPNKNGLKKGSGGNKIIFLEKWIYERLSGSVLNIEMRKLGRKPGEKLLLFRGCLSTVSGRNTPTRFQRILVTRTDKEMLPKKSHSYHRDTNETRPCDTFYWPVVVSPRHKNERRLFRSSRAARANQKEKRK